MGKPREYNSIPAWTATVGSLIEAKAKVRALCSHCPFNRVADLRRIEAHLGPAYSLWNRTTPCPSSGCPGRVWFKAAVGNSTPPINLRNALAHEAERLRQNWRDAGEPKTLPRTGGPRFGFEQCSYKKS